MGFLTDVTGGLIGGGGGDQRRAAERGSKAQVEASKDAIADQQAAGEEAREILDPFVQVGAGQLGKISNRLGRVRRGGDTETAARRVLGFQLPENLTGLAEQNQRFGIMAALGLGGEVSDIQGLDPNVLDSPFFQAQQAEATKNLEQSAASRGRVGAGGTADAIARQSLLLGQQFGQQDFQNRLGAQSQRFGQLQNALGFGLGAQQQGFDQLGQAGQTRFANQLGQTGQFFDQLSQSRQQGLNSRLAVQQQDFNQRFGLVGLGHASATTSAAQGLQNANQISNLQTGIGNAQAAGMVGAANASGALQNQFLGLAGSLGGAAVGGFAGSEVGSNLIGGLFG